MYDDSPFRLQAEVFYIDFGNTEKVNVGTLQPLPADCATLPAQAVPCSLYNITSSNFSLLAKELHSMTVDEVLNAEIHSVLGKITWVCSRYP